jgi:hypothetical protein
MKRMSFPENHREALLLVFTDLNQGSLFSFSSHQLTWQNGINTYVLKSCSIEVSTEVEKFVRNTLCDKREQMIM